jgi:hypothetical protein
MKVETKLLTNRKDSTYDPSGSVSLIKIFSILVILCSFLHQYESPLPGMTLGEFLIILVIGIITLIYPRLVISIPINLLTKIFFFFLLLSFISIILQGSYELFIVTRWIRYSSYILMVLVSSRFFSYQYAIKLYKYFCLFVSIYIILQYVLYLSLNVYLPIKILPIPWSRLHDTQELLELSIRYYFRGYGIFAEPGYSAKFLLPGLALSLFGWTDKRKIDYFSMVLISLAIILTTSVQGILVGLITVVLFTIELIMESRKNIKILLFGIFIGVGLLGLLYLSSSLGLTDVSFRRIQTISLDSTGSTGIRVFRGFAIYDQLPLQFKIIGVGLGNTSFFVLRNGIQTMYDSSSLTDTALGYTSGISKILAESGVIGFLFFLYWFFKTRTGLSKLQRIIFYQFIILLFGGGGILDMYTVFIMGFLTLLK